MVTPTPNAPLSGLKLTFNENFDTLSIDTGTAATDGRTWSTTDAWGNRTQHGPGQKQFYIDEDYYGLGLNPFSTSNGVLDIKAWKTPSYASSAVGGMPYLSGWLTTEESFGQKYGYFEMRAQMPSAGKGMWPAFWLLNAPPKLYWPPEIDIMEAIGLNTSKYWTSIHTKDPAGNSGRENNVGVNIETSMHTYGVDWQADKITFYFDGQKVYERATPVDMHDPMYMLVNLGIGGWWPGDPDGTTDWSKAHYYVDYVRVWSKDQNAQTHSNVNGGDGGSTTTPPSDPNTATSGADSLTGTTGADVIDGLAGNDNIFGDAGNDTLTGAAGNDLIGGGAGDDKIYGGDGNDLLNGDVGADLLVGGNGADIYIFQVGSGLDTIDNQHTDTATDRIILKDGITSVSMVSFAQVGNDLVLSLSGNTADKLTLKNWFLGTQYQGATFELTNGTLVPVSVSTITPTPDPEPTPNTATTGNDTLTGTAGADVIDGLAGNDVIDGASGNDTITGGTGSDIVKGGDGDDVLSGGTGGDTLIGGAGADTYRFGVTSGAIVVDNDHSDTAVDRVLFNAGLVGSNFSFARNGDDLVVTIVGAADTLIVKNHFLGAQYAVTKWVLADGTDISSLAPAAPITPPPPAATAGDDDLSGTSGADVIDGLAGNDVIESFEGNDTLMGGAGDDMLSGGAGNDTLMGDDGADYLDGDTGADRLVGGLGNDTYIVDDVGDEVVETAGEGKDAVGTTLGSYTLGANLEDLLYVGTGNFTGTGNELANTLGGGSGVDILSGMDGDDTLAGSQGNDTLIGGAGADSYMFAIGSGMDTIDNQHTDSAADRIVLKEIAAADVTFARVGDDLVMSLAANTADKLAVKNWFLGSQYQGLSFQLADGTEVPVTLATAGNDSLVGTNEADVIDGLAGDDTLDGLDGSDTLTGGLGNDTLKGGIGDDILNGGDGADVLDGGAGADQMAGGAGNDVYTVDDASDVVTEAVGEGTDGVSTTLASYALAANVENLAYTGTGSFAGTGNALANSIAGGSGVDVLSGLAGDDTLSGGAGNDTLVGGDGADTYLFAAGSGSDTIDNQHADTATDRVVLGSIAASNVSFAQVGNDLVMSLAGNTADKLTVKNWFLGAQYQGLSFQLADGTSVAVTLPEPPPPSGATPIPTATINGASGNDTLTGTSGNDIINGGAGNDTLSGGAGNDTFIGGAGADTYKFGTFSGQDTIFSYHTDTATDRVLLNSGLWSGNLKFVQSGNDLVMTINGNTADKLTVKDWFLGSPYQLEFKTSDGNPVAVNVSGTVTPPPAPTPLSAVLSNATDALDLADSFAAAYTGASTSKTYTGSQMSIAGVESTTSVSVTYDANGGLTVKNLSAWNAIKNATVKSSSSGSVTVNNFVDAEIALGNGANTVNVTQAKRGNIVTGSGNDTISVSAYSNGTTDNLMTVNAGDGANKVGFSGASNTLAKLGTGGGIDEITVTGQASATIWSGAGDDRIVDRSTGNVTVTGGSGKDVFDFIKGAHASITDFNAGDDRIVPSGVSSSGVQVTNNASGTLIDLGGGSTINLVGAALAKDQINIT